MMISDMLVVVLVASTAVESITVLPFWNLSDNASVFTGIDDGSTIVNFSMPFHFNNNTYNNAYISSNGLVSFGTSFTEYIPEVFPISTPVISPYWDDSDLRFPGSVYFESYGSDSVGILQTLSEFISVNQSTVFECISAVVVFWSDVCPCCVISCTDTNSFQVVLASDNGNNSYAVFMYKCGLLNWSETSADNQNASIGYSAGPDFFMNHVLSKQSNVNDIACLNLPNSPWSNVVYKVNEGVQYPQKQSDIDYQLNEDMVCTADCNPLYNDIQYDVCCEPGNLGKFIKVVIANVHRRYIVCPKVLPDWCN